jgi:hypothetical protein
MLKCGSVVCTSMEVITNMHSRAQHFPSNLYYNHQQRLMPIHAHPCYSNCVHVFKNCVMCITHLHHPPTPSLGWIGQINGRTLSLASARSASWLAYSLHPRSLTPIWSWMQGCTKPMPTHETLHRTHAHPKPMGMDMGTQCRALMHKRPAWVNQL